VYNAVKHFRHYLHGRKFVIHTDCNSLKASRTKARVHRWWAFLQAFDFSVQYRKGTQIAHVDCLSRNPIPEASKTINKEVEVRVDLSVITDNWLIPEQQRDLGIVDIMNQINGGEMQVDRAKTFEVRAGMLHRKIQRSGKTRCLPVIPRAFRVSVINHVHEDIMHLG